MLKSWVHPKSWLEMSIGRRLQHLQAYRRHDISLLRFHQPRYVKNYHCIRQSLSGHSSFQAVTAHLCSIFTRHASMFTLIMPPEVRIVLCLEKSSMSNHCFPKVYRGSPSERCAVTHFQCYGPDDSAITVDLLSSSGLAISCNVLCTELP